MAENMLNLNTSNVTVNLHLVESNQLAFYHLNTSNVTVNRL